jgi:hypothetical protein
MITALSIASQVTHVFRIYFGSFLFILDTFVFKHGSAYFKSMKTFHKN